MNTRKKITQKIELLIAYALMCLTTVSEARFVNNNPINQQDFLGLKTYYIGGAMEHRSAWSSTDKRKQIEVLASQVGADIYFPHNEENKAVSDITSYLKKKPKEQIVIIGHSWGGASTFNIVSRAEKENPCACFTVITLDPVSRLGKPKDPTIRDRHLWINVHQPRSIPDALVDIPVLGYVIRIPSLLGGNDGIATAGGQWNDQYGAYNIPTDYDHHNVNDMILTPMVPPGSTEAPLSIKDFAKRVSTQGNCK